MSNVNNVSLSEMKQEVKKTVKIYMGKFKERFRDIKKVYKYSVPSVYFKVSGVTAGTSEFNYLEGEGKLVFNSILMKENWDEFNQTIIHEVAHYCVSIYRGCCFSRNGRAIHHGKEWKSMMRFFEGRPERCHKYDTSSCIMTRQKRWVYKCDCTEHNISTTIHNRIKKGKYYKCNICKSDITLVE